MQNAFPPLPLPSPRAVSLLLLGWCRGAKSWKRNLFKVFRTHVNGQNLLTAELKYLFLLHNKALSPNLSTTGFVPQANEKSLWKENRQTEKMPLVCVYTTSMHTYVRRSGTSPHACIPITSEGVRMAHESKCILDKRTAAVAAYMGTLCTCLFEKLQVSTCLPLTV